MAVWPKMRAGQLIILKSSSDKSIKWKYVTSAGGLTATIVLEVEVITMVLMTKTENLDRRWSRGLKFVVIF